MGKFSTLEKAVLTKDWTLEERSALAHFLEEKKLSESTPVFIHGSQERGLYFIDSGGVLITYEHLSREFGEGESFGEISILHTTSKLASAIAVKDTVLWCLSAERWSQFRKAAPNVSLKLMESIVQKLAVLLSKSAPPPKILSGPSLSK